MTDEAAAAPRRGVQERIGAGAMIATVVVLAVFGVAATAGLAATQWSSTNPWLLAALGLCAAGLVLASVLLRRARRIAAVHRRVVEALDVIPVGFALYDDEERLVLFNKTFNRMIQHVGGLDDSMIGRTYDEVLTRLEAQLRLVFPDRDLSKWKSEYLRRFRQREGTDLLWENGQTMRLRQIPTASGGTIATRMDVTDIKRSEVEAHGAQKRFDLLVNSLSDAVFSTDRKGRFSYLSGAMTQLMGYRPEELVGRRPHELVHPDDRAQLDECIAHLRQHRGAPVSFAHRGLRKDGSIRQVEVRMTAPDRADNLSGELAVTGVMRDVQADHEMAERLRYELQRLNSIVESSGASMVLVDRGMRIIMANKGFINARPGRTADDVVGRPLREVVQNPVDQSTFQAWFAAQPSDPIAAIEYETVGTDPQGRQRTYHVTANPVRDESGIVQHVVFVAVDETERRAAEMQLFDSSRLATVGEMASGVAHEINQPLTIIRFAAESLLEQLQDMPSDAALADGSSLIDSKLARIITQTERAAAIIQELKALARKPDDTPRPVDVAEPLRAATQLLREQFRKSQIEEEFDVDPACPPVLGNAGRLQQVFINLILNARDAILERKPVDGQPRAGTIRLGVRHLASTGKVVATVEDDGPGIPAGALPRLFEPFFTTKPTGKGTGLGLSVSYQIIRQMGGTIVAENRAEGGARFTITLDATAATAAAGQSVPRANAAA